MEMINKYIFEKYNIIYIITNILYITTLTFYVVLEDDIFNKYYVMILFIPMYINYYTTYLKELINVSIILNFIYIITKLIFMITYFNYDVKKSNGDEKNYIIYSIVLYLLYIIEVINIILFYFKVYIMKKDYIEINNV